MISSKIKFREILKGLAPLQSKRTPHEAEKRSSRIESKEIRKDSKPKPIAVYLKWIWPFRWKILSLVMVSLLGVGFGLIQPLLIRFLVDSIVMNEALLSNEKLIMAVCISCAALLITVYSSVFALIAGIEGLNLNARLEAEIRRRVFGSLLKQSLSVLERLKSGGVTNLLVSDTSAMTGLLRNLVVTPVVLGIRILITFVLLFYINWRLSLFAALLVPPALGLSYFAVKQMRPLFGVLYRERGRLSGRLTELFRGIRVLRVYNREARERLQFAHDGNLIARIALRAAKMEQFMNQGWTLMITLAALVIICVGSVLSIKRYATIGDVLALSLYTAFILDPIFTLVNAWTESRKQEAALERICNVLDEPPDEVKEGYRSMLLSDIEIEFKSVCFSYGTNASVLKDISFSVRSGETIAIMGRSGAGKSTLIDLVSRLYVPTSGKILLNGTDIGDIRLSDYRKNIAIVEQDVTLFDGSIGDNIVYANPRATIDQMIEAARKANAHDFIMGMRNGYDSAVGENGNSLSGGEKQRISIARAFVVKPRILIFDEATSNLDGESERSVQASLSALRRDCVTFVVAHRLSTVHSADRILVLDQGCIIEMGTHVQLMALGGVYYNNVAKQADVMGFKMGTADGIAKNPE